MNDKKEGGAVKGLATIASMGIMMVVSTFIGLAIGYYLDRYFGTEPWLTILFLVFGIAAGFKNIHKIAKQYANGGPL